MTTIFFSQRDYRKAQRSPNSSERAHAVCRRLTGCANQESHWYGAHYYAACALLPSYEKRWQRDESLQRWASSFCYETSRSHNTREFKRRYRKLWRLALSRVSAVLNDARALPHSAQW